MDFSSSDANANFEGLLEVNREIYMPQMVEKALPDVPLNCAVLPEVVLPGTTLQTGECRRLIRDDMSFPQPAEVKG